MPNLLAHETSPYLRQHADNPVDWLPWGEAAFARARTEQKPIFLSIGYSTCHWCHVMAHESFMDANVAALLNGHFIAIKVDREERPDVDRVYMSYVQAITGHGGWPLSAWLTPDLKPFYGGTYFPPEDRHGRPGFPSVLQAIARAWRDGREQLVAEGERMVTLLRERETSRAPAAEAGAGPTDAALLECGSEAFEKAFRYFHETFDREHGGFGGAPKFPRASNLNFLFRCAVLQGPDSPAGAAALEMAVQTLMKMAQGGIHDHVGGGFHRYSVDARWFVPHFEKMLYDQAQIALNALDARLATGDERFAWLARDIFGYVERNLTHPQGGFYSAEDADSPAPSAEPGEAKEAEGAFYLWTQTEIAAAAGTHAPLVCAHFGVKEKGNVPAEADPHGEFTGRNILAQTQALSVTAQAQALTLEAASDRLTAALETLRVNRARRPRPGRDEKIVTAWNGLMISALARGSYVLSADFLAPAIRAAEFIRRELCDPARGVLYRSHCGGRGTVEGFAEDYAFLIQGLLDLYEASFDLRWLQWAEQLQQTMDAAFWDEARGGWFNSAAGDPAIVLRLKEDYDGAEPAASSVGAMNLLRLSAILDPASGGVAWRVRARQALEAFRPQWGQVPQAMPQMLCALELVLGTPRHVVLAGDPASADFRALASVLHEKTGPRRSILAVTSEKDRAWLADRAPWAAEMRPVAGKAAAYVCEEFTCQAPVTAPADLRVLLAQ
ncbi:MAG TPA: thioredoxin domain-containing protein [Opitutaceae bacterium]|nr:thioredoxin domain-containing protein [Opitutaceae bacterium]